MFRCSGVGKSAIIIIISLSGKEYIEILEGFLDGEYYTYVNQKWYNHKLYPNNTWQFQLDNAGCHKSGFTMDFFKKKWIIWSMLKNKIKKLVLKMKRK